MTAVNLPFCDRPHAGRVLSTHLEQYLDRAGLLVLALPRGGVAVGFEVARELRAPLDIFVVRKLGVPGHEEYAMGAIASGGVKFLIVVLEEEGAASSAAAVGRQGMTHRGVADASNLLRRLFAASMEVRGALADACG